MPSPPPPEKQLKHRFPGEQIPFNYDCLVARMKISVRQRQNAIAAAGARAT